MEKNVFYNVGRKKMLIDLRERVRAAAAEM